MLLIQQEKNPNGTHNDYSVTGVMLTNVPDGWSVVHPELEELARAILPFVLLTIENGVITALTEDTEAREAWERWQAEHPTPEPTLDDTTALQLAVAELAETQAADQTANELALAELAETIGG